MTAFDTAPVDQHTDSWELSHYLCEYDPMYGLCGIELTGVDVEEEDILCLVCDDLAGTEEENRPCPKCGTYCWNKDEA